MKEDKTKKINKGSEKGDVASYYDEFSGFQLKSGLHKRHHLMYDKLLELGLQENSSVLEIGSGIGMITSLICKTVTTGDLVINDISQKNIELNRKLNSSNNMSFIVGDIIETEISQEFDFITLFDVLEHIPLEKHFELFQKLKRLLTPSGIIFINIPSPECLKYHIKYEKEVLQVIDQPLPANIILNNAYKNELLLFDFKTYSLWHENDYQMMMFHNDYDWEKIPVVEKTNLTSKIRATLKRFLR